MLRLSVKKGDYIMINDDIRIEFVQHSKAGIRVGINAPKTHNIARGKLYEQRLTEELNANLENVENITT